MPRSLPKCLYASFIAPQVTVVTPEECQSNPSTHPNAWNHHGSDSRRNISAGPYSSTTAIVTEFGQPVLDVGCGTGRILLDFLVQRIDIDGVDNSPEMLAVCREKANK